MSKASPSRILLKGGHVISLDPTIGDVAGGDVLIEGSTIVKVGADIEADGAEVIDASSYAVLPGMIDTHRHTWQTSFRSAVVPSNYFATVLVHLGPLFQADDVYIGNLLGTLGALDSGITTVVDWSHIMNSPAHADAAVQGLRESGIRGVFAHGVAQIGKSAGVSGSNSQQHSDDIRRVQKEHFSSTEDRLTLAMAFGGPDFSSIEETIKDVRLARELGIRATTHVGVLPDKHSVLKMNEAGLLGPDITYIHAMLTSDEEIKLIADSGGSLSASALNENLPGLTRWLKHGLRPSLSVDTETVAPPDLFGTMRALSWHEWAVRSTEPGWIPFTNRDVLEFATIQGARATGLEHQVGSLAPGKKADIILVDLEDIATIPRGGNPVDTVTMVANPHHVRWVFVDGEVRKRDGKLVGVDVAQLHELARASQARLRKAGGLES
jgi:5-methylthioadenosine/S-adenosylhomocysteine deaminase